MAGLELPDRGSFMAACTSDDVEDPDGGSDMDENLDILDDRRLATRRRPLRGCQKTSLEAEPFFFIECGVRPDVAKLEQR